jgi:hypothetical protein
MAMRAAEHGFGILRFLAHGNDAPDAMISETHPADFRPAMIGPRTRAMPTDSLAGIPRTRDATMRAGIAKHAPNAQSASAWRRF